MEQKLAGLLNKLGQELINSPYLSVMILNRRYQLVWHNQRFADEFNHGQPIVDSTCWQAVGSAQVHANCPLHRTIANGRGEMEYLDVGDQNFLYLTIPLDEEHAAKVHIFLPKQAKRNQ